MTPFILLFAVSLLVSCEIQGSSAVSPVYVQQGKDILLNVTHSPATTAAFFWKFNKSINVVQVYPGQEPIIGDSYKRRAEFYKQNYSLLLKNLQQDVSGDYVAQVTGQKDEPIAEYTVIVEEPVSPVYLTLNSKSPDSCNFTVTCSTEDSHIFKTFRCDNKTCSQQGGDKVTTSASINVFVQEGYIICNHSNHVSWEQDKKEIKTICKPHPVIPNGAITIGTVTAVAAILLAVLCISIFKWKRSIEQKNDDSTVYAVPQEINPAQTQNQNPTEDSSGPSPTSTYAMVGFHTGPEKSTKTKTTSLPETIYAQVNRAAKPNSRPPHNQHLELEDTDGMYLQN